MHFVHREFRTIGIFAGSDDGLPRTTVPFTPTRKREEYKLPAPRLAAPAEKL